MEVAVLGLVVGVVGAAWAVLAVASSRAESTTAELLSVVLAIAPIVYFNLPDDLVPKPGAMSRALGWITTSADTAILGATMIVVAVLGYVVAAKLGVVRWLTDRLDRPSASGSEASGTASDEE